MTQEHHELQERLKDERSQKEQFKNTKNEIEDERRLLDRTVEKLQREVRIMCFFNHVKVLMSLLVSCFQYMLLISPRSTTWAG